MAGIFKLLSLVLFVALMSKVTYQQGCDIRNIKIAQVATGSKAGGKPEWKVTITNDCKCTQTQIKLSCSGFQSAEPVDPSILSKNGDVCLLVNGGPIFGFQTTVTFNYAADSQCPFKPVDSIVSCS
ncbi:OLC1v1037564C1 [Oldenlandia corymbosa var. corymbosa]|uniref:OLC1v1037564C1 n=1 Tax=Oldenlandia corymbosa var. corymbosa TaxID=529605 RepID=A0AAV1CXV1_OLDCO|nr:OLC1v1037564C1 [Oldenlandia corymbosa var. corymbosa]